MKYISLFSGIGGFEIAIHNIFKDAVCIAYSEIDKFASKVYEHHFPNHYNLGDVTKITEDQIKELVIKNNGIDLLVGGFPCQNLSSLARNNHNCNSDGLDGPKSGLFWNMVNILKWILKYNPTKLNILIENNASMTNDNKRLITEHLQSIVPYQIYMTKLNGADFGVQTRRRLYWTTFEVDTSDIICKQTWEDILEPIEKCYDLLFSDIHIQNTCNKIYQDDNKYAEIVIKNDNLSWKFMELNVKGRTKFQKSYHSTMLKPKSTPIITVRNIHHCILDYRPYNNGCFLIRYFHAVELERLFWIEDGWVSNICSKSRCAKLLGNTVVVHVIEYILTQLMRVINI